MRITLPVLGLWLATVICGAAAPEPSAGFDLAGHWGSTIEFGKMKMKLVVKVTRSPDGKLAGKIDIPDQGAKDIPVSAMLFNYPAVRWEIDPFDNTAFNGKVSGDGNEIAGEFEEGPGGRPIAVTFKRLSATELEGAKRVYTFEPGEARDIRGYWLGAVADEPGSTNRVGLKIGRGKDGSFEVLLDLLDRGAEDARASAITSTNGGYRFEWQLFRVTIETKLENDGNTLTGTWRQQRGKASPVTFARRDRPAKTLPDDLSFTPEPGVPDDIRGEWKGVLETPDNSKLRLVLRVGKTPDGTIAGTLASPDQGGREMPMTTGGITNQQFRLEWKGIRGVFKGTLTNEGAVLDGTWEQMGPGLKLRMERTASTAATTTSN